MRRMCLFATVAFVPTAALEAKICGKAQTLASPDGAMVARFEQVGAGTGCGVSRVEVVRGDAVLVRRAFSNGTGQGGYGVDTAAWTPDSAFLVFDLSNSDGHSPLYEPIFVFDAKSGRLFQPPWPRDFQPSSFRLADDDTAMVRGWDSRRRDYTVLPLKLGR